MSTQLEHPSMAAPSEFVRLPEMMNLEAEQAVIGAALSNNEAMQHLNEMRPEDFAAGEHQWIFRKMLEAWQSGERFSPVTLMHLANERGQSSGQYLAKLVAASTSIVNLPALAEIIRTLAIRRDLVKAAIDVINAPKDADINEVTMTMTTAVENAGKRQGLKQMHNAGQVTELVLRKLRMNVKPCSTGIERLDKAMYGGLYPGKMYAIAARKKVGKTLMLGTISYNLNQLGERHLFICGEMGEQEIHQRQIARSLGIPFKHFLMGTLEPEQRERMIRDVEQLAVEQKRNVIYLDAPAIRFDDLKMAVQNAVLKHNIRGYMLDYWQLVQGKGRAKNPVDFLDEVAQWVAWSVKRYDIWNITTSQVNKEGSTRGGEGLLNACDQAYMLHRSDITRPEAYMEMMDTRYTSYMNVGSENEPSLHLHGHGPYYKEVEIQDELHQY